MLVAGLVGTSPAHGWQPCPDFNWDGRAGTTYIRSDWQEFTTEGRTQVQESGQLDGIEFNVGITCGKWRVENLYSQATGRRRYQGRTATGAAAQSWSDMRQAAGQLAVSYQFHPDWQFGVRLLDQTTWRNIASISAAAGYPERFSWTLLSLGLRTQKDLASGRWSFFGWAGQDLRTGMHLQLPGRDPATLALGNIDHIELGVGWGTPLNHHWLLEAAATLRRTTLGQGAVALITRSGAPAGVAFQPSTVLREMPLSISLRYQF